jgi:hypothetical protein
MATGPRQFRSSRSTLRIVVAEVLALPAEGLFSIRIV